VTDLDGEHNGRMCIDGDVWWQVSYADIGESLGGIGRYSVRRIMLRLEEEGLLEQRTPSSPDGDQTKAYRIPSDLPMCDSATAVTSQSAESQRGVADSQQGGCEIALSSSSVGELQKFEEEGERPPARETSTLIPANFHPALAEWAQLAQEYPGVDLDTELKKFIHHHQGHGSLRPNWLASFESWLDKVPAFGTHTNGNGVDGKGAAWQASKCGAKAEGWKALGEELMAERAAQHVDYDAVFGIHRQQLAIEPFIDSEAEEVVAGDSAGGGELVATAIKKRRKQVAA
jgi:hypothetical protein